VAAPDARGCCSPALRRRDALALLSLSAAVLLVPGAPVAWAQSLEELRRKQAQAAGDLEHSSSAVRDAAARLRSIRSRLVAARSEVAKARGQLAAAKAKAVAARAEVERAEAALRTARAEVDAATQRVQQGRDDVGRLARRSYQSGRLDDLRQLMESGEPQDAVTRAGLLRSVFRFRNSTLTRLNEDRLALAGTLASLASEQRALDEARARADAEQARAREIAERAQAAAAEVETLAAQQAALLRDAEQHRAQDARDYEAARAASQALAERIRAAAARAEAARKAAARKAAAAAEAERKRRAAAGQRARAAAAPKVSATGMLWPAPGRLTSRFGIRIHPLFGDPRFHAGIDIGGGMGARVRAARDGYVSYAGYAYGYGTLVVVSHGTYGGRDLSTAYAHMSGLSVSEGQLVSRGQRVGSIGNEGNSTGPHLHFEVRRDGEPVDPLGWIDPP